MHFPRRPTQQRRLAGLIAIAWSAAALISPAAAHGAFSSITAAHVPDGELVRNQPTPITVSGHADPRDQSVGMNVEIHANQPGRACAPTPSENSANYATWQSEFVEPGPTHSKPVTISLERLGPTVLCVYLWDHHDTFAFRSVPVNVRLPHATLNLKLPKERFRPLERTNLAISATAETPLYVYVARNRLGIPCGRSLARNDGDTVVYGKPVHGAPLPKTTEIFSGGLNGRHHLCGWIATGDTDPTPAATFSGLSYIVGPSPWCRLTSTRRRAHVRCARVSGRVELQARVGAGRLAARAVRLRGGRATLTTSRLGVPRGKRATITIRQAGLVLGRATIRVR